MKASLNYLLRVTVTLVASAAASVAQTGAYNQPPPAGGAQAGQTQPESVRPGSLNYVEGQVAVDGQALNQQSVGHAALQRGQALTTGDGYAEILLTPGSFLRVGPNSELRMTSVGLADTRISLVRGNAMVEADQVIDGTHLEVTVDRTSVDLLKKGLYGFSANPPAVKTFDGQADVVGMTSSRKIGKRKQVLLANNDSLKASSFDKEQEKADPLYVWSEARSRDEAAQNQLVAQSSNGYTPVGSGWFWDPYVNGYGFWGPDYFYSPFGFGFNGGYYPGFYGGYYGRYNRGYGYGGGWRGGRPGRGGVGYHGYHGNGAMGGFHGGGGGFHGGGGGFHGGGGGGHAGGGGGGHR